MNNTIAPKSHLWPLASALQALVTSRGGPANCERFELEDSVLRAGGFAWDIGDEAAPLHTEIARLDAEKRAADDAEAARIAALPPEPWRVSKDTLIGRVLAAGKLPEVMAELASQTSEQQFVFEHSAWFWSTNETLREMCAVLGMNPEEIFAPDPYL